MIPSPQNNSSQRPLVIALAGMLSLAVGMGIGRFAFTPLMPMMLHDQLIDLAAASWLASANYLGYLLGALLCTMQPRIWSRWQLPPLLSSRMVRIGLVTTCALTAFMAINVAALWPWLRFMAGIVTAMTFVYTSSWCLTHLSRLNAAPAGAIIFAGPGIGILVSGLMASVMVLKEWRASSGWLAFGALAAIMTGLIWRIFRGADPLPPSINANLEQQLQGGSTAEKVGLTIAYGLAGFGYIITATFLPVIARTALPGSAWLDLFWPILGLGVACGALLATRIPARIDQRLILVACYLVQAAGVAFSNWLPSLTGFALGSILVGLPFTVITFFVMQLGRRLHPQSASGIIGLLSASFALCQIAGPPVAALLLARAPDHATGFAWALNLAAITLLAGAGIYLLMMKFIPAESR
jgi:MFS family permease